MTTVAAYDPHADWYEDFLARPGAAAFTRRVHDLRRRVRRLERPVASHHR